MREQNTHKIDKILMTSSPIKQCVLGVYQNRLQFFIGPLLSLGPEGNVKGLCSTARSVAKFFKTRKLAKRKQLAKNIEIGSV
jgi:hypothetical protein